MRSTPHRVPAASAAALAALLAFGPAAQADEPAAVAAAPGASASVPAPAQAIAAPSKATPSAAASAAGTGKRVVEDDKVRIEETRLRGQTQSVTVHSKLPGVRDYEVIMPPLGKDPSQDKGAAGKRTWSLFGF